LLNFSSFIILKNNAVVVYMVASIPLKISSLPVMFLWKIGDTRNQLN